VLSPDFFTLLVSPSVPPYLLVPAAGGIQARAVSRSAHRRRGRMLVLAPAAARWQSGAEIWHTARHAAFLTPRLPHMLRLTASYWAFPL